MVMAKSEAKEISPETTLVLREIGSRIRSKRKLVAKNYEVFAKNKNVNKVTLSRIENGDNYTMRSLIEVLRAMDLPIEELFKGIK